VFLGLWRGVNPERLACVQGRPLHRSIDAACILEQESRAVVRQRHHSKMAASYHLGFYRTANRPSTIRSADPENHNLEPNVEWFGFEIFANYTVILKPGFWVTRGYRKRHYSIERIYDFIFVFHSNCLHLLPFPRYSRILVENCYTPCIWHPHWG